MSSSSLRAWAPPISLATSKPCSARCAPATKQTYNYRCWYHYYYCQHQCDVTENLNDTVIFRLILMVTIIYFDSNHDYEHNHNCNYDYEHVEKFQS